MATVPNSSYPSLSEQKAIVQSSLDRLTRRIRLALWVRYASYAALAGSVLSVAAALAWRSGWQPLPVVPVVAVIFLLALCVATFVAFRSPIPRLAVARLADDREGLKQRLSSSLTLVGDTFGPDSTFVRLQMADAAAIAPALDARKVLPLRPRWEGIAAIASVLLAVGATWLVLRSIHGTLASGASPILVAQEGAKLAEDARRIASEADAKKLPQTRQYADKLARLARQMQSRQMPQAEAVKRLADLSKQVRQQQNQIAKQSSTSANARNNASMGIPGSQVPANHAQMGNAPASLSETLRKMADQVSANRLTPAQQKQMADDLNKLADRIQSAGLPQTASHVNQAAKALAGRQQSRAASELREAAHEAEIEEQRALQQGAKGARSQSASQTQKSPGAQTASSTNQVRQMGAGQEQQSTKSSNPGSQQQHAQGSKSGRRSQSNEGQAQAGNQAQSGDQAQSGHQTQSEQSSQAGQNGQQSGQSSNSASSGQQANGGQDAQGLQSIERSLQQAEQRLSGQSRQSNQDVANAQGNSRQPGAGRGASQKPGSGKGKLGQEGYNSAQQQAGGAAQNGGSPSNVTEGSGKGSPTAPGKYTPAPISGSGYQTPKNNVGVWQGKPQQLDPYNPAQNNRYARVYLPTSTQSGRGTTRNESSIPGAPTAAHQVSTVPYYKVYPQFKKGAEAAINKEDIPRAYSKKVRQYFQALTPPGAH